MAKYYWSIDHHPDYTYMAWELHIFKGSLIQPELQRVTQEFFPTVEAAVAFRNRYFQYLRDLKAYIAETDFEGEIEI